MKFEIISKKHYKVYIIKPNIKIKDYYDKGKMINYLKEILNIISNRYLIKTNGLYNIDLYDNNSYGIILDINKEELDYYDIFTNEIDITLSIHENTNMYLKIEDILEDNLYLKYNLLKKDNIFLLNVKDIKDITIYEKGTLIYI